MSLSIGSLFSGIGGLELGLEMAGLGPVRWQVEIDPHARAVLAAHWPEVTRHEDVKAVGAATLHPVDLVCGGFPCQDVSSAGKRAGLGGSRSGLWFEFRRVVSELRPQWVVVENVASGAAAWVDRVTEGLVELGYRVIPVPLSAADVGAPHERARVFLVAHADGGERRPEPRSRGSSGRPEPHHSVASHANDVGEHAESEYAEVAAAPSAAADAERDAVRLEPRWSCGQDRVGSRVAGDDGAERTAADAVCARRPRTGAEAYEGGGCDLPSSAGGHLSPTFCEWLMGFPVGWTLPVRESARSATQSSRSARKSSGTSSSS